MKPEPESSAAKWDRLVARARTDAPPPLEVAAALRAARTEASAAAPARSWLDEFAALFATPRRLAGGGGLATGALVAALWFGLSTWSQLEPWADLVWSALEDQI